MIFTEKNLTKALECFSTRYVFYPVYKNTKASCGLSFAEARVCVNSKERGKREREREREREEGEGKRKRERSIKKKRPIPCHPRERVSWIRLDSG